MNSRKGIILAGGSGTRLHPLTLATSKHLLPIFDKPMIYYPLCTLMLANIQDILIISTPRDLPCYQALLGDGTQWGVNFSYAAQTSPEGIAQAYLIGKSFLGQSLSALILGDNIFYGHDLQALLASANARKSGATLFTHQVNDPERYGVAEFDEMGNVISLEEKPKYPKSNYAVTGLYFYDENAVHYVNHIQPSGRGELEITDLNKAYLEARKLHTETLPRGYAWLDTGTHESLFQANQFVQTVEYRQGLKIACPEEIAFQQKWIDISQLEKLALPMSKNDYGQYITQLLQKADQ